MILDFMKRVVGWNSREVREAVVDLFVTAELIEMLARASRPEDFVEIGRALPMPAPVPGVAGALHAVIESSATVTRTFLETRRGRPCERLARVVGTSVLAVREVAHSAESEAAAVREHGRRLKELSIEASRASRDACEGACDAPLEALRKLVGACERAQSVLAVAST